MEKSSPKSIDEYIERYPKDIQVILHKIRVTIKEAAPDAKEAISYQIPTFKLGGNLVHFAAFTKHISFFPTSSGVAKFKKDLEGYETSKGTIRFPLDKPIPYDLISKITKFRLKEVLEKGKKKKSTSQADAEKSKAITFHTTILQTGKNTTGIQVPEEIIEKLGSSKRLLVRVTIKEYTYRSAVAVMGDKFMVGVSAANRQATSVQGGEEVDVTIELDLEPRTVDLPEDLKAALTEAGALKAFENSAPSMRKEYVRQVEDAKEQETRERRIVKIVEKLSGD